MDEDRKTEKAIVYGAIFLLGAYVGTSLWRATAKARLRKVATKVLEDESLSVDQMAGVQMFISGVRDAL